jgi:hypothetical protein
VEPEVSYLPPSQARVLVQGTLKYVNISAFQIAMRITVSFKEAKKSLEWL